MDEERGGRLQVLPYSSDQTVEQALARPAASCKTGEPLPFMVNDILVQFDDDRTAASLCALADVASRTQVILLTHHQQVKRHAERLTTPASVMVHELSWE
jgi:uncharacterized protein YhaN